jgi:hypothetical protein
MPDQLQASFFFQCFYRADHGFDTQPGEIGNVLTGEAEWLTTLAVNFPNLISL